MNPNWREMGCDTHGADAVAAVRICKAFSAERAPEGRAQM
jgi:hypothetical protein